MKYLVTVLALSGLAFGAIPASAANKCIDVRNIVSCKSEDGRTMVFRMKDGAVLVNHLQGICSDLRFNGFAWTLHSGDTKVCEHEQSFRVIQSGQVCTLGKFDPPMMGRGTN
jgi:hypothetical protein